MVKEKNERCEKVKDVDDEKCEWVDDEKCEWVDGGILRHCSNVWLCV